MQPRGNRTFICSVAFLDIIEYSKKGVTSQIKLKEELNSLLGAALKDVAASDRIILDTGDGAAISFVGDPEEALFVCLRLRDSMLERPPGSTSELNIRIGVNLGPVKLIKDLNNQANIVGDGINVAQRIMSFAAANQILVSRSYYEVVSCLSENYAKLFHYEGSRTDKHVREHEVYAVGDGTGEFRRSLEASHAPAAARQFGAEMARSAIEQISSTTLRLREELRARPRVSTALAVLVILVLAVSIRGLRDKPATRVAQVPDRPVVAKSIAPPPVEKAAPAPTQAAVPAPAPVESAAAAPLVSEKPAAAKPRKEKVAVAPARKPKVASAPVAVPVPEREAAPALAPAEPGFLAFAIAPWGEIYVNGRNLGVSPPLQELKVVAGRHRVEVRNTSFTPHVQIVEVKSGERIRIKHRFQ